MATCDMGFEHESEIVEPDPAPVIVEPGPNENDVKIAEIEAAASIAREELWTEAQAVALEANNERLEGELRGIKETLAMLAPPDPEPQEIIAPDPAPVIAPEETGPPAPPMVDKPAGGKKSGGGWFDGYR